MNDATASRAVDIIIEGLALEDEDGTILRKRAVANLVVGLLRHAGGQADRPKLERDWALLAGQKASLAQLDFGIEAAEELGYLEVHSNGTLALVDFTAPLLMDQVRAAFPSFAGFLVKEYGQDAYDKFVNRNFEPAFEQCIRQLFRHAVDATLSSTGTPDFDRLQNEFAAVAATHVNHNPDLFSHRLIGWLRQSNLAGLGKAAVSLMTLLATLRIIDGSNKLADATVEAIRGSHVFLDTNCLVQFLCPASSTWNNPAEEVFAVCQRLGITVSILDEHFRELSSVLDEADEILSNGGMKGTWMLGENQFVHEFVESGAEESASFVAKMRNEIAAIQVTAGFTMTKITGLDEPAIRHRIGALQPCLVIQGSRKKPKALERDAKAILFTEHERRRSERPFPSPWLLTFDGRLATCEAVSAAAMNQLPTTMTAQVWLAGIGAMIAFSEEKINTQDIATAWLAIGIAPPAHFTMKDVATVIATGLKVPAKERVGFVKAVLETKFARQANAALHGSNSDRFRPLFESAFAAGLEHLGKELAISKEAERVAKERVQEMARRLKDEKERKDKGLPK